MEEQVKFKRSLVSRGDSAGINIPKELVEFIGAELGDELIVIGDKSKRGKYIAVYKEEGD